MSRIQDILNKAERDGTARRTRSLGDYAHVPGVEEPRLSRPATEDIQGRGIADEPPASTYVAGSPSPLHPNDTASPERLREIASWAAPASPSVAEPFRIEETAQARRAATTAPVSVADPAIAHVDTSGRPLGGGGAAASRLAGELDPHLVAALAPTSLAAEKYRSLRTRLKRVEVGRVLRTIAITSPAKGDGKSLTASNLALTMAQEVQRVLLIDCDLRRPSIHRLFGLEDGHGLVDVLMNATELDEALVWLPDYQLTILPSGIPPSNPAELLGSASMRRTLDRLRPRFERILIDVPPVAPLADLHVLAPLVDGLLMIIRAGMTQKPSIDRALAGLDPSKVLGLVLNEAGIESVDAVYGYEGYGYIAG